MFTLQWRCFIDNLTGLFFSREKVIATELLTSDRKWKLLNIQKRELISSICKTLRVHGVHRNVTQYSPVLQRFSAKTNELSLALTFSYSVVSMHVQYSLSETTRKHDLSTRKMHLIRGNRRTAVPTNRTIRFVHRSYDPSPFEYCKS